MMADIAPNTSKGSPRISKTPDSIEFHNCAKCVEVEMQLKQVLEKLSSAQLIIQMLKKETTLEEATATTTTSKQHADLKLLTEDYWQVKSAKEEKGKSKGKWKIRNNERISSMNGTIEISNRYVALATNDGRSETENKANMYEELPNSSTSLLEINTERNKQERIIAANPQKETRMRDDVRHNLKSNNVTPRRYNAKETKEIYTIPTIINGRIQMKAETTSSKKRATLQQEREPNTEKRYAALTNTRQNILLLGDSHARGLAEGIGCSLCKLLQCYRNHETQRKHKGNYISQSYLNLEPDKT
jgi:hypothetical protein